MKIFDTHVHFPWGEDRDTDEVIAELVERARAANVVHMCLLGSRFGDYNQRVTRAIELHPDLFVGLYGIDLDNEGPQQVHEAAARGFRGLKVILPLKRYDDPSYFPIYEAAEEHGFTCLFHTGVVGGGADYRVQDPFDPELIERVRSWEQRSRGSGLSSAHMEPIYLDTIAFTFPELKIIGAHLGIGYYDVAAHIARWRRNVFFDLSGGEMIRRHIVERHLIPSEISHFKLLYGSDNNDRFEDEIRDWQTMFDILRLGDDERERIMYGNAARLFGMIPTSVFPAPTPTPEPEPAGAATGDGNGD
jgi:predicted TIM-barrel fold metal-dependent hydrolase